MSLLRLQHVISSIGYKNVVVKKLTQDSDPCAGMYVNVIPHISRLNTFSRKDSTPHFRTVFKDRHLI